MTPPMIQNTDKAEVCTHLCPSTAHIFEVCCSIKEPDVKAATKTTITVKSFTHSILAVSSKSKENYGK